MTLINKNIGSIHYYGPEADELSTPKARKTFAKAIKLDAARAAAMGALGDANDAVWRIKSTIAAQHAEILEADPDAEIPDPYAEIEEAEHVEKEAKARLDALLIARDAAVMKMRAAFVEEAPLIAKNATNDGDVALSMLVAAIDTATEARDALHASIGIGGMGLRLREDPSAEITIRHKAYGYTFDIAAAIEGLSETLVKAAAELDALKAEFKSTPGKKPSKGRKAASEAHSAAETLPAPAPVAADAIGFDIGSDDDEADDE